MCSSNLMCNVCNTGYYLKFNFPSNYSCEKCADKCSYCYLGNETFKLNSSSYNNILGINVFNDLKLQNSWRSFCIACEYGYLSINGSCNKCSSLINGCSQCNYSAENQIQCTACTGGKNFNNYTNNCEICALGCEICDWKTSNIELCLKCLEGYILIDNNCVKCPLYCLICYVDNQNQTFCSKCNNESVLIVANMSCQFNLNLTKSLSYLGCSSFIIIQDKKTLCQTCLKDGFLPSFSGYCKPCSNGCLECIEIANYSIKITPLF